MDTVMKWVPLVPQPGDIRPSVYMWRYKGECDTAWQKGTMMGTKFDFGSCQNGEYRIPAPVTPLDIDIPYLLKKSAACSPPVQSQVLALKSKFAAEIGKLIADDEAAQKGGAA